MSQFTGPTLAGFGTFITNVMQISALYLPTDAPIIGYAYNIALGITNPFLACAGVLPGNQWSIYALAVYNLGGSNLINYAQDQPGYTYFADMRKTLGIANFAAGVITSTSDQGTSASVLNPEFMKNLTLANLQQLKDPWGRTYLQFSQSFGPLWGLS